MSLFGSALAGPAGMLGLSLLGAYTDVERAEEALAEEYGVNPPGYPRGYNPELSTFEAFVDAVTPFGMFGKNAEQQLMDEMEHLAVVDLENPYAYQAEITPEEMQAEAEAEAAAEAVGSFDPFSPGGWSTGWGSFGEYGGPGASDIGGEDPSGGEGSAGGGDDPKIVCSMMNRMYGFGFFRNTLWLNYQAKYMPEPEWQLGYHKLFLPLTRLMPTNKFVRKALEYWARHRTVSMRREMRGRPLTIKQWLLRKPIEFVFFIVGRLIKMGLVKEAEVIKAVKAPHGPNRVHS